MSTKLNTLLLAFTVILLTSINSFAQKVEEFKYPNGELKTEVTYDKDGVITKYKEWDNYGNLVNITDFSILYNNYPKKDFSKIKWIIISEGVQISKLNISETKAELNDSSFVTLNYICYFSNGKMLDNTFAKGCPLQTRLDHMVKGFILGVKNMMPGETAFIKIDSSMAFGDDVAGNVPAKSTLIYLVELISVN
jgi:hypothetical protein